MKAIKMLKQRKRGVAIPHRELIFQKLFKSSGIISYMYVYAGVHMYIYICMSMLLSIEKYCCGYYLLLFAVVVIQLVMLVFCNLYCFIVVVVVKHTCSDKDWRTRSRFLTG